MHALREKHPKSVAALQDPSNARMVCVHEYGNVQACVQEGVHKRASETVHNHCIDVQTYKCYHNDNPCRSCIDGIYQLIAGCQSLL
jgi:hypothetical protein